METERNVGAAWVPALTSTSFAIGEDLEEPQKRGGEQVGSGLHTGDDRNHQGETSRAARSRRERSVVFGWGRGSVRLLRAMRLARSL